MPVELPRIDESNGSESPAEQSEPPLRPAREREWFALTLLMIGYALIFMVFYPPLPGIEDEIGFVNQTLVWSRGAISAEGAGYSDLADFMLVRGRHVAARHPGRSVVALPFVIFGGVHAAFVSGLVLHLAMTLAAAVLFVRLGRSPLWALLLLVHPTLAIYSRTIMADASAGGCLLLAAIAVTSTSRWAGLGAGGAVGLAASMRYHSALALPIVALSFLIPRGRPRPWRDAILCVIGGAATGSLIAVYNLCVYGTINEPFTGRRGYFSTEFLVPHLQFYGLALMTVWPAMLIAPLVDRSSLRWLIRGVCGLFLGFLMLYYFHDRGSNWLETAIVGQRLLQVALPLWVVSYGGMLDDWIAAPLRKILGRGAWQFVAALACVGSLLPIAYAFQRHQEHLKSLLAARQAVVANIPKDSLILFEGALSKLVGIPTEVPPYRIESLTYESEAAKDPKELAAELARETRPWYVAVLRKGPGAPMSNYARKFIIRQELETVPTTSPILSLYVHRTQPK